MDSPLHSFDQQLIDHDCQHLCGVDEVGRGCLAGPVFAAAVIFEPGVFIEGVTDSKKISPKKREQLFELILQKSKAHAIAQVGVEVIDAINILQASLLAMKQAVDGLSLTPDLVLVDGNQKIKTTLKQQTVIDGDAKSFAIAAASILAKVSRDRLMKLLSQEFPGYGFEKNMGYGTAMHLKALQEKGITPIHRKSFSPVRFIMHGKENR